MHNNIPDSLLYADDPDYPYEKVVVILPAVPMYRITRDEIPDTLYGFDYKVNRLERGVVDYIWDAREFAVGDTIYAGFDN